MDNFHIDITSEGSLEPAMRIAFGAKSAVGYRVVADTHMMVLYWSLSGTKGVTSLPFKMDAKGAADFVSRWLAEQDYGPQPDHDGDNGKGWRLFNETWGHVGGEWQAFVAVRPCWAMYGK